MVCCIIGYHSRYISPIPDYRDIGRMWKCCDKVKNFCFVLGFWDCSGCDFGVLDQARGLLGGKGCIYLGLRGSCVVYGRGVAGRGNR